MILVLFHNYIFSNATMCIFWLCFYIPVDTQICLMIPGPILSQSLLSCNANPNHLPACCYSSVAMNEGNGSACLLLFNARKGIKENFLFSWLLCICKVMYNKLERHFVLVQKENWPSLPLHVLSILCLGKCWFAFELVYERLCYHVDKSFHVFCSAAV